MCANTFDPGPGYSDKVSGYNKLGRKVHMCRKVIPQGVGIPGGHLSYLRAMCRMGSKVFY